MADATPEPGLPADGPHELTVDSDRPATLDFVEPIKSLATPATRDLEPGRDKIRAALALGLLGLLTLVVVFGFSLLWFAPDDLADSDADLKSRTLFIQAMLTPVASLFGAATGFYFGTRQSAG